MSVSSQPESPDATPLPPDLVRWVKSNFAAAGQPLALACLTTATDHTGLPAEPRLLRCAAFASQGDLASLRYYIDLLRIDYRDVIVAGEYDPVGGTLVHARDLSRPFADCSRKRLS
jgi:hypothetical protein